MNKLREGRAAWMTVTVGCAELGQRPGKDPHIRGVAELTVPQEV